MRSPSLIGSRGPPRNQCRECRANLPGYAAPWAAPGVPLKAIKWMFQRHAPLAVRLDGTQFQLKWMWQMLRNCDTSHYMENKGRMVRLAEYSRDCLKALRAETNIQYEGRQGGTLQLFRTEQQYENATRDIAVLEDAGVPYQLLESSRLAEVEPALAEVAHKLTGGLQLPNDETGDCQLFTQNLARMAEQAGVKFRFNTPVDQLLCDGEQIYGVKCGDEVIKADAYVMAFGSYSTAMLKGIVDIPVYPLKGYSLTIPIAQEDGARCLLSLMKPTKSPLPVSITAFVLAEWRKLLALTPSCCNRVVKRWRWWFAISIHAAVMLSRRLSGLACAR